MQWPLVTRCACEALQIYFCEINCFKQNKRMKPWFHKPSKEKRNILENPIYHITIHDNYKPEGCIDRTVLSSSRRGG